MADREKMRDPRQLRQHPGNWLRKSHDDAVVLDADAAAAPPRPVCSKAYQINHFDCGGIAEGNMVGVAAGLATMGYVPFVSNFAMFAAGRL